MATTLPPHVSGAIGIDLRHRRPRRRAPIALTVLALTALGAAWCWDNRRPAARTASLLLALVLAGQLVRAWSYAPPTWPDASLFRQRAPTSTTSAPDAPAVPIVSAAPAVLAVPVAPAAPAADVGATQADAASAPDWQPLNAATFPYPDHIESWRPLVRELLAEAWSEGRLDGPAARLDDDLVLAVIRQESQGDPDAESWAGAIGLMQVMPFTFADVMHGDRSLTCAIDPAAMWDVRSNVRAGLRYLALSMNAHEGNLYWALASYNAGIDAVYDWRAAGLYAVPPAGGYWETANYAQVILRDYLRRRPDVTPLIHVPDPMPYEHVPGALRLLRDLPDRPPEWIPRCARA